MATHKDDKKSDNVAKKKRPNARVLTKAERIKMEKRKETRRKAKKKAQSHTFDHFLCPFIVNQKSKSSFSERKPFRSMPSSVNEKPLNSVETKTASSISLPSLFMLFSPFHRYVLSLRRLICSVMLSPPPPLRDITFSSTNSLSPLPLP